MDRGESGVESRLVGKLILLWLKALAWGYAVQPHLLRKAWGSLLGTVLYLLRLREKVVSQNLEIAFPKDRAFRERLFKDSYSHLGKLVLEILLLFGPMRSFVSRNAELSGVEHWRKAK